MLLVELLTGACRQKYRVGDHVLVEWRGADTPAVIISMEGATRIRVHYDGYSDDWDETVAETRLHGQLAAHPGALATPEGARIKPPGSASANISPPLPNVYRVGEHIRVEWHGAIYGASVVEILEGDRYRIHYDGYGNEWDESIGLYRIQRK